MENMKFLWITHTMKFLGDTIDYFNDLEDIDFRIYKLPNNDGLKYDWDEIRVNMDWADVIFHDWCPLTIRYSREIKDKKHIMRMHRYEFYRPHIIKQDFSNIDIAIFDSQPHLDKFLEEVPGERHPKRLVVHTTNWVKAGFEYKEHTKKEDILNILMVGTITSRKGQLTALYYLRDLFGQIRFRLTIAAMDADKEYWDDIIWFLENNKMNVDIKYNLPKEDIIKEMQDNDVILSMSRNESAHLSIPEGMACGCFPVINNWYGADYHYDKEYIFNTIAEFKSLMIELYRTKKITSLEHWNFERKANSEYALSSFSKGKGLRELEDVIRSV